MNTKKWFVASVVAFLIQSIVEFVVHGIILAKTYQGLASLWRSEAEMHTMGWLMWIGYLISSPVLAWVYVQGYDKAKNGFSQGLRFGLMMGILLSAIPSLIWYVILPIPQMLAFQWTAYGLAMYAFIGIGIGLVYRD